MLEEYQVHNPVPLVVGSCVGGLLMLALISAVLYKVSVGACSPSLPELGSRASLALLWLCSPPMA